MSANGGFLSAQDLTDYAIREVAPIHLEVGGRQVWSVPPEGGGALLLEILGILDRPAFQRHACGSAAYHHHLAQACKLAFIDRMDYLGDVPLGPSYRRLLAPENLERLFGLIDPDWDTPTDSLAGTSRQPRDTGKHTTHFAIDRYHLRLKYHLLVFVGYSTFYLSVVIDRLRAGTPRRSGCRGPAPGDRKRRSHR